MAKNHTDDLVRVNPEQPNQNVRLTLPVPPSNNSLYYNTRGGGRRLTSKAQDYIRDSRASLREQIQQTNWNKTHARTWTYLDLIFYFPDRRVRDSHNCLKILMDVLEGIVYENDYSIMPRIQSVEYDTENPRVDMLFTFQTEEDRTLSIRNIQNKELVNN